MARLQSWLMAVGSVASLVLFAVPTALGEISNIQLSNLSSSSATVTWTTADSTDGSIRLGLTTALGDTLWDAAMEEDVHFVQIPGLMADTVYYFEVASGDEVDNNGGDYYTFETTPIGVGIPYSIYGQVYPVSMRTIVSAVLRPEGGGESHHLATLTDDSGMWLLNLGNLKDATTGGVMGYSSGDTLFISLRSNPVEVIVDTVSVSGSSPQYCGEMWSDCLPGFPGQDGSPGIFLLTNSPNPFRAMTVFRYQLPAAGPVCLDIYDVLGQCVARLVDGPQAAGARRIGWQTVDVPAGVYFARLRVGGLLETRQLVVEK